MKKIKTLLSTDISRLLKYLLFPGTSAGILQLIRQNNANKRIKTMQPVLLIKERTADPSRPLI
jgi:hypothetical protein